MATNTRQTILMASFSARWRRTAIPFSCACALVLAGCSSSAITSSNSDALTTGSLPPGNVKEVSKAASAWQRKPKDIRLGLAYADGLKRIGSTPKRLQVLATLAGYHPDNPQVQSAYGKALLQSGQPKRAIIHLEKAAKSPKADWQSYSALGSAYDQTSNHQQARRYYDLALKKNPKELRVWNNLGMSHILSGEPAKAEQIFRQADQDPASRKYPQIRQNLGLAVGLQGRFDEAKQIVSRDLPPDQVEANIQHLQKLLARQNTWQQLQQPKS